jgi:hypothetical protein
MLSCADFGLRNNRVRSKIGYLQFGRDRQSEKLCGRSFPGSGGCDFLRTRKKSNINTTGIPLGNTQLPVNWLYGAYIPKDAALVALNGQERFKLYVRQTYTTPGIYIKTGFFAMHDQVRDSPPAWGDGFSGFAKRVGSNQATNIIQNSFTSLGQGIVGWEPRYDRCRCTGAGPRFRHAFIRNFITYDHSEQSIRPNIMPFAAAFGAGAIGATWNPNNPTITVKGYQSVITQAWVGVVIDSIGEFAPDLKKKFSRHKD